MSEKIEIIGGELSTRVVNVGTAENPSYGGSAYAVGHLHGVRAALEALKALNPRDEYAYDDCVEAVQALLPK